MSEHIKIGDVSPRIRYEADGVQTEFVFPFPIFTESDLVVYLDEEIIDSGFAITGSGNDGGGSISFAVPPAENVIVTLLRKVTIERLSDFQTGGAFRAQVINDELDKLTAGLQQVAEELNRCVKLPPFAVDANLSLPQPNAGKALLWEDASGKIINSSSDFNAIAPLALAAQETATIKAAEAFSSANAAAASAATINLPAITANTYLKAKADGSGYDVLTPTQVATDVNNNAPSGTQIAYAQTAVTSNSSTTTTDYSATVATINYTPKKVGSLIVVEFSALSVSASHDYGSTSVDANIGAQVRLKQGSSYIGGGSVGVKGKSDGNGEANVSAPSSARGSFVASSLNAVTISAVFAATTSGITAQVYGSSNYPAILSVKEIAQ